MGGLDNVPTEALRTAVERLDQYMSDLRWERLSQVNSLLWAVDDNALAVQLVLAALNQVSMLTAGWLAASRCTTRRGVHTHKGTCRPARWLWATRARPRKKRRAGTWKRCGRQRSDGKCTRAKPRGSGVAAMVGGDRSAPPNGVGDRHLGALCGHHRR